MLQDIIAGLLGGILAQKFLDSKFSVKIKLIVMYLVFLFIFSMFSLYFFKSNMVIWWVMILSGLIISAPASYLCVFESKIFGKKKTDDIA